MGVYSIIIDYQPNSVYLQYKKFNLKKYFTAANIRQGLQLLVSDLIYAMPNAKGNAAFSRFKKEYMLLTKELYRTSAQMKTQIPWFDAVIVGSDQVWNTEITGGVDPIYMLENFHAPTKKISYAASLGSEHLPLELRRDYSRLLADFSAISVREESGCAALMECGINKVKVVLDPTLLLKKEDWIKVENRRMVPQEPYLLVYMVYGENRELIDLVNMLSEKTRLKIVTFQGRKNFKNECKHCPTAGPADFIALFDSASLVVTNSFHGTAFSITLEKEFYVCLNSQRNDRMVSLLNKVGLSRRIWKGAYQELDIDTIDYIGVGKALSQEREQSLNYLYNSIFGYTVK